MLLYIKQYVRNVFINKLFLNIQNLPLIFKMYWNTSKYGVIILNKVKFELKTILN